MKEAFNLLCILTRKGSGFKAYQRKSGIFEHVMISQTHNLGIPFETEKFNIISYRQGCLALLTRSASLNSFMKQACSLTPGMLNV